MFLSTHFETTKNLRRFSDLKTVRESLNMFYKGSHLFRSLPSWFKPMEKTMWLKPHCKKTPLKSQGIVFWKTFPIFVKKLLLQKIASKSLKMNKV